MTPTVRLDRLRSVSMLAGQVTGRWGCALGCPTTRLHMRKSSVDSSPFRDKTRQGRQAGEPQNHTLLKSALLMLCPYMPLGFHVHIGPLGSQHYTNHFSGASRPQRLNSIAPKEPSGSESSLPCRLQFSKQLVPTFLKVIFPRNLITSLC